VKCVRDRDIALKERKKEQTKIKRQEAAKLKAETRRLLNAERFYKTDFSLCSW